MILLPCLLGLFFLARNFFGFPTRPLGRITPEKMTSHGLSDLSIVIPARNEERNLPILIQSLKQVFSLGAQIIIVDDNSTDETLKTAHLLKEELAATVKPSERDRIKVLQAPQKPAGWSGKNWACHTGAEHATNAFILFTDADTVHSALGLLEAMSQIKNNHAHLLTSLPFHMGTSFWEQSLCIFHVLLIQSTRPGLNPKSSRLYANGQFLLFQKKEYLELGGHQSVKDELCEDLLLAKKMLQSNGKLIVAAHPLYKVRMYTSLQEFISGWSRNFSLGLRHTSPLATMEMICLVSALFLGLRVALEIPFDWTLFAVHLAFLLLCTRVAKRLGNFPLWSVLFWPWAFLVFFVVTMRGLWLLTPGRAISWKGRSYLRESPHELS